MKDTIFNVKLNFLAYEEFFIFTKFWSVNSANFRKLTMCQTIFEKYDFINILKRYVLVDHPVH